MSHIIAYNSVNGSCPYNPQRNDAMLNPHKYGMDSFSNTGFNTMLGNYANTMYFSNTSYSGSSNSSRSSNASKSSYSSSGGIQIRSDQFCSYGLWH